MSELDIKSAIPASLWHNNPSLVHMLGLSPMLAVSDSSSKGFALAVGTLLTCMVSATGAALLRPYIDTRWRYLWFSLLIASAGTLFILLLQLFWFPLSRELGVYSILIACNLALMLNMDNYYQNNNLLKTTREASILGVALMLSLVLFAMLREFLITGGVFHDWHLLVPGGSDIDGISQSPGEWLRPVRLHPAGFILLGLLIALGNWLGIWQKTPLDHREESPVRRARVSGVLKKED